MGPVGPRRRRRGSSGCARGRSGRPRSPRASRRAGARPTPLAAALGLGPDPVEVVRDARGGGVHRGDATGRADHDPRRVRVVLQRVRWARVTVGEEVVGEIGPGLLALVGVAAGDAVEDAALLARKTVRLRVLAGDERPFDRSLLDVPGAALLLCEPVHASRRRAPRQPALVVGRRAPRGGRAPGQVAYAAAVAAEGVPVERGRFGAAMAVSLENDGPVTLVLDSAELRAPRSTRLTLRRARRAFESRQIAQRSPGWMTSPPRARTRSSAAGRSSTAK